MFLTVFVLKKRFGVIRTASAGRPGQPVWLLSKINDYARAGGSHCNKLAENVTACRLFPENSGKQLSPAPVAPLPEQTNLLKKPHISCKPSFSETGVRLAPGTTRYFFQVLL